MQICVHAHTCALCRRTSSAKGLPAQVTEAAHRVGGVTVGTGAVEGAAAVGHQTSTERATTDATWSNTASTSSRGLRGIATRCECDRRRLRSSGHTRIHSAPGKIRLWTGPHGQSPRGREHYGAGSLHSARQGRGRERARPRPTPGATGIGTTSRMRARRRRAAPPAEGLKGVTTGRSSVPPLTVRGSVFTARMAHSSPFS